MNLLLNLKEQKGSAVVSFALVTPLILINTLIILQFIFSILNYAKVSNLADYAARQVQIGHSNSQIIDLVKIRNFETFPKLNEYKIDFRPFNNGYHQYLNIRVTTFYSLFGVREFLIKSSSSAI